MLQAEQATGVMHQYITDLRKENEALRIELGETKKEIELLRTSITVAREDGEISHVETIKEDLKKELHTEMEATQGKWVEVVRKTIKQEVKEEAVREEHIRVQDTLDGSSRGIFTREMPKSCANGSTLEEEAVREEHIRVQDTLDEERLRQTRRLNIRVTGLAEGSSPERCRRAVQTARLWRDHALHPCMESWTGLLESTGFGAADAIPAGVSRFLSKASPDPHASRQLHLHQRGPCPSPVHGELDGTPREHGLWCCRCDPRRSRSLLQAPALQTWSGLQQEHCLALKGTVQALESAIVRVPVTGAVKADTYAVKEALDSALDVMNSIENSVNYLAPKAKDTYLLMSELARVVAQERNLIEECADLVAMTSALEMEECSLRAHIVQMERERRAFCVQGQAPAVLLTDSHR
ncbi:hypothetical protein L7F22_059940 [Adiantum nelumboides]|nr:hypothetical protein [Adiantum nelumboides]